MRLANFWRVLLLVLAAVAASHADSVTNGLVARWGFDGTGNDSTGHGYDLTLVGNPTFATGAFGQALQLDGTGNQYATRLIDDAAFNLGASDFTVQIWADFTDHSREETLIEKFTGGGGPGWTFTTRGDLQFYPAVTSGGVGYPTHEWHQYVAERSGSVVSLYIDGNLIVSGFVGTGAFSSSPNPLLIGKRNSQDGRNFAVYGLLDDAAFWNRSLSQSEIQSLHDNGFQTPEPGSMILLGSGLLAGLGLRKKLSK